MADSRLKTVIVFRWLKRTNLPVALWFRALGWRVIFMESTGKFQNKYWRDRFHRWGLECFDFRSFPDFNGIAHLAIPEIYAGIILEKEFSETDLDTFLEFSPALENNSKKAQAILFDTICNIISPYAMAYALGEYLLDRGYKARIFQSRSIKYSLLNLAKISSVKNLCPVLFSLAFVQHIFELALRNCHKTDIQIHQTQIPLNTSAKIIFFPHKGIGYGNLYNKNYFYSDDQNDPFHKNKITHIETNWTCSQNERLSIEDQYLEQNLEVLFVNIPKTNNFQYIKLFLNILWKLRHRKNRHYKALLFTDITSRVQRCRVAFRNFSNTEIAIIGYTLLFPKALAIALQSYGVKLVATQERFFQPFQGCLSPILDYYFVHGEISQGELSNKPYADIGKMLISGDPMYEKISHQRLSAKNEREKYLSQYSKACLVLDAHSSPDQFSGVLNPGAQWVNNIHFYETILITANENPECLFIIRGKNCDWMKIPVFQNVKLKINDADNIRIDIRYDIFERSYQLAAIADFVIARLNSLCDQCLADGIPVFVYDAMKNGDSIHAHTHDYSPYDVMVLEDGILREKVRDYVLNDVYIPSEKFQEMRRKYYGIGVVEDPKLFIHRHLTGLLSDNTDGFSPDNFKTNLKSPSTFN